MGPLSAELEQTLRGLKKSSPVAPSDKPPGRSPIQQRQSTFEVNTKTKNSINVRENDKDVGEIDIWQRFPARSIYSTLRLHSLRTVDLYNERQNFRRGERQGLSRSLEAISTKRYDRQDNCLYLEHFPILNMGCLIFFRFRLGAKYHLFNLDSVKYFFLGNKMSLILYYNIFFFIFTVFKRFCKYFLSQQLLR